jgi:hypothetical protein
MKFIAVFDVREGVATAQTHTYTHRERERAGGGACGRGVRVGSPLSRGGRDTSAGLPDGAYHIWHSWRATTWEAAEAELCSFGSDGLCLVLKVTARHPPGAVEWRAPQGGNGERAPMKLEPRHKGDGLARPSPVHEYALSVYWLRGFVVRVSVRLDGEDHDSFVACGIEYAFMRAMSLTINAILVSLRYIFSGIRHINRAASSNSMWIQQRRSTSSTTPACMSGMPPRALDGHRQAKMGPTSTVWVLSKIRRQRVPTHTHTHILWILTTAVHMPHTTYLPPFSLPLRPGEPRDGWACGVRLHALSMRLKKSDVQPVRGLMPCLVWVGSDRMSFQSRTRPSCVST